MARGDHNSGKFRGGGDRARLGGHGRSERLAGGDYDAGVFGAPRLTDVPFYRTMSRRRHRHGSAESGGFGLGRRMRRGRRH